MNYHRDILKRSYWGRRDDRFLNPKDGRPSILIIQCSDDVRINGSKATWTRTRVSDKNPLLFILSQRATGEYAVIYWIPTCVIMTIIVSDTATDRASY